MTSGLDRVAADALSSDAGTPGAGKVLVVDGGGSLRYALLGDMIGRLALESGAPVVDNQRSQTAGPCGCL